MPIGAAAFTAAFFLLLTVKLAVPAIRLRRRRARDDPALAVGYRPRRGHRTGRHRRRHQLAGVHGTGPASHSWWATVVLILVAVAMYGVARVLVPVPVDGVAELLAGAVRAVARLPACGGDCARRRRHGHLLASRALARDARLPFTVALRRGDRSRSASAFAHRPRRNAARRRCRRATRATARSCTR